ncbi:DUF2779 domain-containing protein [Hydrogenimonas cancrithermarum]|uniref:DUF2779 domain-containing protein n=1 Tax=Hydrogenimonas cancrithermarum TaxID=2993563 RepID=A0ABN6WXJ8_9BACT|nr:DUF2779 domain-containing protein [Hydrogenimonas cancrithermarum]BDY14014.1 hypothetical protein HCR_23270 [Hydrogenimonas cancrithermarum]
MGLSKSSYLKGLQCPKLLWLSRHRPEVLAPTDAVKQRIFDTGNRVGELARGLFPGGSEIPFDNTTFSQKCEMTRNLLESGEEVIYEATFATEDMLVMVDILRQKEDGALEIYEVKSSTWSDKKKEKDLEVYLEDVAVQYHTLIGLGYTVSAAYLVLIDSSYERGERLETDKLFVKLDVTGWIEKRLEPIGGRIGGFIALLGEESEPDADIGAHCNKPYECPAKAYCWRERHAIPENESVFDLLPMNRAVGLYEKGVVRIDDIPEDEKLSENQRFAVEAWKKKRIYVQKEEIARFVASLTHPLCHMDFETFQEAVPSFAGQRPYRQMPFQYSLHIETEEGGLEQREFLAQEGEDPRPRFVKTLLQDIPSEGTILVYNKGFEAARLEELARDFPEHADALQVLKARLVDLGEPFKKRWYYHWGFLGQWSIKRVLPLLVPDMQDAYARLNGVHHGEEAMDAYLRLPNMTPDERDRTRRALLEYCGLDTLAMVEILKKLRK